MSSIDFDEQMTLTAPAQEPQAETSPDPTLEQTTDKPAESKPDTEQKPQQDPSDTLATDGEAKPEAKVDGQVKLPESVKDYADLYSKKQWTGTTEEVLAKVSKAYQELEPHASQLSTHVALVQQRSKDIESSILSGDLNKINELRKANGFPELQSERSVKDRTDHHQNLMGLINQSLQGDKEAFAKLDTLLIQEGDSLREASLIEKINGSSGRNARESVQAEASRTFNSLVNNHPDAIEKIDGIYNDKALWPLFQSLGVNEVSLMRTPERAEAAYQLASLVHTAKNVEAEVQKRLKVELEKSVNRSGASSVGKSSRNASPSSQQNNNDATLSLQNELMGT